METFKAVHPSQIFNDMRLYQVVHQMVQSRLAKRKPKKSSLKLTIFDNVAFQNAVKKDM